MSRSIQLVYVEEGIVDHPRTRDVLKRFPAARRVPIGRYGEVFNRKAQSFRLQKKRPALLLARKHDHLVLPAPGEYGLGGGRNYYFSHMLNCVYDCRYCFLQGMYRSGHYVLFVNYEDFQAAIDRRLAESPDEDCWFFSGYDCDSLALDKVSGFVAEFLPFFARRPRAWLELRTKTSSVAPLMDLEAFSRCVVAFSFTPAEHAGLEKGVPSIERRLAAMRLLAERGWPLGLRFDPLLDGPEFEDRYRRLYPDEPLFAASLDDTRRLVSYGQARERQMIEFCAAELARQVPAERLFACEPQRGDEALP